MSFKTILSIFLLQYLTNFFIIIFFNNYFANLLFLENHFKKNIYSKNVLFLKNKFDIFLVIFYIDNFKIYIFSKMFDF